MLESGGDQRFADEAAPGIRMISVKLLDRDGTLEDQIAGTQDPPQAAAPDLVGDPVSAGEDRRQWIVGVTRRAWHRVGCGLIERDDLLGWPIVGTLGRHTPWYATLLRLPHRDAHWSATVRVFGLDDDLCLARARVLAVCQGD